MEVDDLGGRDRVNIYIYHRGDDNKIACSNSSAGSADLELGSGASSMAYQTVGYTLEVNTGYCDTIDESDHMEVMQTHFVQSTTARGEINDKLCPCLLDMCLR